MTESGRIKYLRFALLAVGVIFIFGIYPLTILWPSGWSWHTGQSDYLQMILGIYATLGVFLLIASRNPVAHLSLIWFTVWSSIVHGGIMTVQALRSSEHMGHLLWRRPGALCRSDRPCRSDATRRACKASLRDTAERPDSIKRTVS